MITRWFGVAIATSTLVSAAASQPASPRLKLDPAITARTLPNGLQYFVQRSSRPPGQVEIRLAVRSGLIHEREEEQGFSHLLSHIAVSGVRGYSASRIAGFLPRSDADPTEAHSAAAVLPDETVYRLTSDSSRSNLDAAIAILGAWAGGMRFTEAAVVAQRRDVIREIDGEPDRDRRHQELEARHQFPNYPRLYQTVYGQRAVVGTATPARLSAFYHRRYRPDLMAVVVVGDVDVAQVGQMIRRYFAGIPRPATRLEPAPPAPRDTGLIVEYMPSHPQGMSAGALAFVHPRRPNVTEDDFRRNLSEVVFGNMLTFRFMPLWMPPRRCLPGTIFPAVERIRSRHLQAFNFQFGIGRGDTLVTAIATAARELRRLRDSGFTAAEFDSAKAEYQAGYDKANFDNETSATIANVILEAFLDRDVPMGDPMQVRLARRLIPGITLEDMNRMARDMTEPDYRVLTLALAPNQAFVPLPDSVRALFDRETRAAYDGQRLLAACSR